MDQGLSNLDSSWFRYNEYVGKLSQCEEALFPDFLIIGPCKTGTTWIADILRRIDGIFIPQEKELHYFDYNWKDISLSEYVRSFDGHISEIKGEATPAYAFLPSCAVSKIITLKPTIKIICLVRHPVTRAWSQLKDCRRGREDTFRYSSSKEFNSAEAIWHLASDYNRSGNDYLDILSRWETLLPNSSIFVDYFESATSRPIEFFGRLIKFLGGSVPNTWDGIDVWRPRNVGDPDPIPLDIRRMLVNMYAPWIEATAAHLAKQYKLDCPWHGSPEDKYSWPVLIGNVFDSCKVFLDRMTFVAVRKSDNREIARCAYLGDLLSVLRELRGPYDSGVNITSDRENHCSRRLIALLESTYTDRLVRLYRNWPTLHHDWVNRGMRIEELQNELMKRDAMIHELQGRLKEKVSEIERLHDDWVARGALIEELQNELMQRDATIERLQSEIVR